MAQEGAEVIYPIHCNDQFHLNAADQVTLGNGTPLVVPFSTAVTSWDPTRPTSGVAVGIPANGNFRASLDPNSGRIANAAPLSQYADRRHRHHRLGENLSCRQR